MGYELDYKKIAKSSGRPRPLGKRAMERIAVKQKEDERKAVLMGASDRSYATQTAAWEDRVARDLGLAFHEVGIEEFEKVVRTGISFKGRRIRQYFERGG